jgi:ZIP family zinc transporter/zinc and cadmium transporter
VTTALWYALAAAAGNVAGGLCAVRGLRLGLQLIEGLLAFGAGFMLSVALVEVLPEAFARGGESAAAFVLLGYLLVHLTQHTATQHFHFGEETHAVTKVAGMTALIGLLLHTFFDGVAIASGFAVSGQLGVLLFLAVLLHKLPEGVTICSLQVKAGRSAGQAIGSAAILGAATFLGVVLTDAVAPLATHGLALAGGVTLYVAASNLVPEFQGKRGWALPAAFFGGALAFFLVRELLGAL